MFEFDFKRDYFLNYMKNTKIFIILWILDWLAKSAWCTTLNHLLHNVQHFHLIKIFFDCLQRDLTTTLSNQNEFQIKNFTTIEKWFLPIVIFVNLVSKSCKIILKYLCILFQIQLCRCFIIRMSYICFIELNLKKSWRSSSLQ